MQVFFTVDWTYTFSALGARHSNSSPYTYGNFLQRCYLEPLNREKSNCPEKIRFFRTVCTARNRYNLNQVVFSLFWTFTQTYALTFNLSMKSQILGVRLKSKPVVVCKAAISLFSCHFLEEGYLKTKQFQGTKICCALKCLISRLYSTAMIPLPISSQEMTLLLR